MDCVKRGFDSHEVILRKLPITRGTLYGQSETNFQVPSAIVICSLSPESVLIDIPPARSHSYVGFP